jgi:hypothetical protein
MAKKLLSSYTFTPGAANVGTVVVPGTYTLEQFLLITNVSSGTTIYQFNVPSKGATLTTGGGNTTLTLELSTVGMSGANRLQVFIDDLSTGGGGGLTDAELRATAVPVSVSGVATAANQTTGNSSLSSIDGKVPTLASGRVPVDGSGVTQPVSGTFWQATQPVSGPLTDVQLRAASVPVSGTFWQATQPISGSVSITGSAAVTGPLTDTELRATAVPVSGTFWQATQPISGSVSISGTPTVTGPLTDTQLRATSVPVSGTFWQATQPVSAASLPLPTGAASETTLAAVNGKLPALDSGRLPVVLPPGGGGLTDTELRATPVQVIGTNPPFMRAGFAEVGSGIVGKAAEEFSLLQTGSGMTVNQSAGNLVITTGTTANSETVIRSIDTFSGSLLARAKAILSQRIANQTFRFELADLIGEALSYTINSATSITVTFPTTNPFTAANVGQSVRLSRITGAAGIPGRYAIASVSGLTVNFTVASWPASGSGTLTLYGWNYIQLEYSGTTATNASFDAQRRGWNSGNTTITTQTSASPGHVAQLNFDVFTAGVSDALVASNTAYQWANRGSRIENVPDPDTVLYLFIVVQNGSTAPASTTTLTTGFIQIEDQGRQKIRVASSDPVGSHALPVQVLGGVLGTQPVSGTVTSNIGTGTVAAVTAANLALPGIIADVASAALATTTTTSAFTPTFGISYSVSIPVTAATGTTPTLDISIQESDDSGTNWFTVYDLPRITATGIYRSPLIRMVGNRVRYVQTVGGTTPSFTRSINRLQNSTSADAVRQLINRSVVLTTLNSTTPSLDTRGAGNRAQLVVNVGAITTTAPALQMEGSDDNGATWYAIGAPLTAVASSTVQLTVVDINAGLMRVRVSTAGSGVTAGYVLIKAHD